MVRNSLLRRLSIGLFCVAGFPFACLFIVKQQQLRQKHPPIARWAAVASPSELEATYTRTVELRRRWQPWALEHQAILRKMLASSHTGGQQELMEVYNNLPGPPSYQGAGFGPSDIFKGSVQYANCAGIERISLPQKEWADPMARQRHKNAKNATQKLRQHNFLAYHDIAYVRSMTVGPAKYTFWVSGRITKTIQSLKPKVHRSNPYLEAEEQEVAPPYDFLIQDSPSIGKPAL